MVKMWKTLPCRLLQSVIHVLMRNYGKVYEAWEKNARKITNITRSRFLGSSAGKESACNAGDPGLIPELGRCPGEGIGYPLQYSWASLVVQMVKKPPTMRETWVQSLGWEGSLEEGMATHSSILAWRIPMDRGAWWATVHGLTKNRTWLSNWTEQDCQPLKDRDFAFSATQGPSSILLANWT